MTSDDLPVVYDHPDPVPESEQGLDHVLVRNTGELDELAIFPADIQDTTDGTTDGRWVTALEGSFVCLEELR